MTTMKPPRWMIRRDLKDQGFDPMLPRRTDKCWCVECGLYFNSTYAFDLHRIGKLDTPERRCLTTAQLRKRHWTNPTGHWRSPNRDADFVVRRRQE